MIKRSIGGDWVEGHTKDSVLLVFHGLTRYKRSITLNLRAIEDYFIKEIAPYAII